MTRQLEDEGVEKFNKPFDKLMETLAQRSPTADEGHARMSRPTQTASSTAQAQLLTERPAWKALKAHYATIRNLPLRQLFADDPRRGERLTAEAAGIYLDSSKNRITDETIRLLVRLAEECGLRERIDEMSRGERINVTEKRAVHYGV